MYLPNKYTTWYYSIITKASKRINNFGYTENHHVIPKSLGGSNNKENLVRLTPKEHYICHLLLTKMVEKDNIRKMWYAHYMMMKGTKRHKPNARMYELAKTNMAKANKDRPGPNLGKVMSDDQKKKLSNSLKGRILGPMSEEHKQKLSKPKSEEHRKKISESRKRLKGGPRLKRSEETRRKIGEKTKGQKLPTIICSHCNRAISSGNFTRWHGDNCKLKSYANSF